MFGETRLLHPLRALAFAGLIAAGCSNAGGELVRTAGSEPTVAGITTETTVQAPPTTTITEPPSTVPPTSEGERTGAAELPAVEPTGLDVPVLLFGDSITLVQPNGEAVLIQRDEAVRVAGDTRGGVVFQRRLVAGPQSTILWQPDAEAQPTALLIPASDQLVELHGITTVNGVPEAVFSVTSPDTGERSLNRIDLESQQVVELRVVDDEEFGSKSTQVDGFFIVTTWERPNASGWSVYQSGTGREIGGSFADVETSCAAGVGPNCARLASLSLDIETVFRVVPHAANSPVGQYDLLLSRSENGSTISRVDLTSLDGEWYPEHMSELPDGRILLSRSVDPRRVRPMRAVVIDPATGSFELLPEVGFVRLT